MTLPWDKFFWSDWYSDKGLHLCSYAARGLWMDMLCIAADSRLKGYLVNGTDALGVAEIARLTGGDQTTVGDLVAELEHHGVFSRNRQGIIYSRKMVRDEIKRRKNRDNGKLGGNPILCNPESISAPVNLTDKSRAIVTRSQKPESFLTEGTTPLPSKRVVEKAFADFVSVALEIGIPAPKKLVPDRRKKLAGLLRTWSLDDWHAALDKLSASTFLKGGNDRGWKVNFDWLLKPDKFQRVIEGTYDDGKAPKPRLARDGM